MKCAGCKREYWQEIEADYVICPYCGRTTTLDNNGNPVIPFELELLEGD